MTAWKYALACLEILSSVALGSSTWCLHEIALLTLSSRSCKTSQASVAPPTSATICLLQKQRPLLLPSPHSCLSSHLDNVSSSVCSDSISVEGEVVISRGLLIMLALIMKQRLLLANFIHRIVLYSPTLSSSPQTHLNFSKPIKWFLTRYLKPCLSLSVKNYSSH